jgi:metal-responsive CopG/Arc/MetJ family transcriptional regulator
MQYDNSRDAAVQLRLGSLFDLVENWRRSQAKIPPRSEAIRELVRRAIEADQQHAASRSTVSPYSQKIARQQRMTSLAGP